MSFIRKSERGQVVVLWVVSTVVLLGMAALVVDVGAWWRDKRRLQGTADAAALAGAQELPQSPGQARTVATNYANDNGGDVAGADITVSSGPSTNDTIDVTARRTDPGFFSNVLGIGSANISAHAKARVGPPVKALHVAPMVVDCDHPLIQNCTGAGSPRFGPLNKADLNYDPNDFGAPGAFGMLNLDGGNGTPGSSDEADWIRFGFNKYLGLGDYRSDPGAKFSSSNIQDALTAKIGEVLLFPVYRTLDLQGQNATYDIMGWIGFRLTSFEVHGNNAILHGYFTEYIAEGILSGSGPDADGDPTSSSFGVKSIQLIE
jgi:Putative Flp pilus-assembly TadE/G-like